MKKKNSYICVLVVMGFTLLTLGDYVKGVGSAKLLSESMSNRLFGGPSSGCQHQCNNGSCCDDKDLCHYWFDDPGICNYTNARYNTNGKRDWVCKPKYAYMGCTAQYDYEDCAVSKKCYYDYEIYECEAEEEANETWNEAMTCFDLDGRHTSN